MRGRFSEAQIVGFLREVAAGTPVVELCWTHSFSRSTFRAWKVKYGAAIDAEEGQLQDLELENARLRKSLATAYSDLARLRRQLVGAESRPARAMMSTRVPAAALDRCGALTTTDVP
jgi:putative transposase